ncbi:MAG: hypothetical protein NTW03_18065, partial [Verrucomicrobia bacterium]|nr:hypothetical protein [Verrucomicrobiota bacterium]
MLGEQEPDADLIARNFIGQRLADRALQAFGIDRHRPPLLAGALHLDKLGRVSGVKRVEFFFA